MTLPPVPARVIAIVGAGFSGVALTVQLLQQLREPARVVLIGQPASYGRGLAYGTPSAQHLLNVPAGRMSLDPAHENGFSDYLQRRGLAFGAADFVPRSIYGDYLASCLDAAQHAALPGVVLERRPADVLRITRSAGVDGPPGRQLVLGDGSRLEADQVVLATGNFASLPPAVARHLDWAQAPLFGSPWAPMDFSALPPGGDILLVGSGLTAMDMVLQLVDRGHTGKIVMISRRGQLAKAHRHHDAAPRSDWIEANFGAGETRVRVLLRELRQRVADAKAQGGDWRDVMGSLRSQTARLWQQLSPRGRAQFVRHLGPYWDVHRHRAAPEVGERMQKLMQSGQVLLLAGNMTRFELAQGGQVEVSIRGRGQSQVRHAVFKAAINCIGPCADLGRLEDPLIQQLLAAGDMVPDALGLGLECSQDYGLRDARGRTQRDLCYLGPFLKAGYWEATAVPELRVHAQVLAHQMVSTAQYDTASASRPF
jgi:uncharacterized NAD(P)/FAD-binding protein YdhS